MFNINFSKPTTKTTITAAAKKWWHKSPSTLNRTANDFLYMCKLLVAHCESKNWEMTKSGFFLAANNFVTLLFAAFIMRKKITKQNKSVWVASGDGSKIVLKALVNDWMNVIESTTIKYKTLEKRTEWRRQKQSNLFRMFFFSFLNSSTLWLYGCHGNENKF